METEPAEHDEIDLAREGGFTLGQLRVSPSTLEVQAVGRGEVIEPRVMQALVCLSRAQGKVVSRDELIRRCWGGRIVGDDAINRCIAKVRHIAELTEPSPFVIDTIPRVGYRLRRNAPETPVLGLDAAPLAGRMALAMAPVSRPDRRLWGFGAATACLALVVALVLWRALGHAPAAPSLRTVAVLPIRNLTGDASLDPATDHLTENLAALEGRGSWTVAPSDATFAFKGKPLDDRRLGRALHVRNVISAGLARSQTGYRVSYEITDTTSGQVVGRGQIDSTPTPGESLPQARLALLLFERTSEVMRARWMDEALARRPDLRDPDYVEARMERLHDQLRPQDIPEALSLARAAPIAFAKTPALRGAFDTTACFYFEDLIGAGLDRSAAQRAAWAAKSLEFGRQAVAMLPYSTSPHECQAYAYARLERWDDARAEADHIFQTTPLSRNGLNARATLEFDQGRFKEALADFTEFGARVGGDPLDVGATTLFLGDDRQAIAELREATVSEGTNPMARFWLAAALEQSGRHSEALEQADLYRRLKSNDSAWRWLGLSHEPAFQRAAARVRAALHAAGVDPPARA